MTGFEPATAWTTNEKLRDRLLIRRVRDLQGVSADIYTL